MDESRELGVRDTQSVNEGSGSSGHERAIVPDTILSAVANEHRRAILDALDNASEKTLAYDALVDRVADRVRDEDAKRESDEHRQRVQIALHHTHLPKLEETGIIDYDSRTKTVQYHGHPILDTWHGSISESGLKRGENGMGHNQDTLTLEGVFDILQSRHRRIALGILKAHERTLTLRDLTNEIAASEHDDQITDIPTENVNQLYVSLAHTHVPKLADRDIIQYDQERDLIDPTDRLAQLEPYLSLALEADPVVDLS